MTNNAINKLKYLKIAKVFKIVNEKVMESQKIKFHKFEAAKFGILTGLLFHFGCITLASQTSLVQF